MRGWDEFAARVFDVVPPGTLFFLAVLAALLIGAAWYWFPAWIPRRLPRFPRRAKAPEPDVVPVPVPVPVDKEPEPEWVPAADLTLADRLAAEGRYAEAIRQRLRDAVGHLVAARIVAPQPGWTAAEVATTAAGHHPGLAGPLGQATDLFSEVWYGDRPAHRSHDDRMRVLTDQVRAVAR